VRGARIHQLSILAHENELLLPPNAFFLCIGDILHGRAGAPDREVVPGVFVPGTCDVVFLQCIYPYWWLDIESHIIEKTRRVRELTERHISVVNEMAQLSAQYGALQAD